MKLHKFQNMKSYMVHEDTVIADYVGHSTLHDGTVVHCFSKELLAFLETLVAFCPYYRANDPRAAGAMDNYYTDTLRDYGGVSYDDLHNFLTDELTAWYARLSPAKAVDSYEEGPAGDANVGDVIDVRPAQTTNAFSAVRRRSAPVDGPAGADGQPAPAPAPAAAAPAAAASAPAATTPS